MPSIWGPLILLATSGMSASLVSPSASAPTTFSFQRNTRPMSRPSASRSFAYCQPLSGTLRAHSSDICASPSGKPRGTSRVNAIEKVSPALCSLGKCHGVILSLGKRKPAFIGPSDAKSVTGRA